MYKPVSPQFLDKTKMLACKKSPKKAVWTCADPQHELWQVAAERCVYIYGIKRTKNCLDISYIWNTCTPSGYHRNCILSSKTYSTAPNFAALRLVGHATAMQHRYKMGHGSTLMVLVIGVRGLKGGWGGSHDATAKLKLTQCPNMHVHACRHTHAGTRTRQELMVLFRQMKTSTILFNTTTHNKQSKRLQFFQSGSDKSKKIKSNANV